MTALATADLTANAPAPFAFEGHQIRTVVDESGQPWFVAKDVCTALGIKWNGRVLDVMPAGWKRLTKTSDTKLWGEESPHPKRGGLRGAITVISEPAVYKLAFRSNKTEADRFTNWIASEVIPALRRQGKYEICPTTGSLTPSQQQELKELVQAKASAYPDAVKPKVFSQIWMRLQRKFKVPRYAELPVSLFGEARDYIITMQVRSVEAPKLPQGDTAKSLSASSTPITIRDYASIFAPLPSLGYWSELSRRLVQAHNRFQEEFEAIKKDALNPFREGRRIEVATFLDFATIEPYKRMLEIADDGQHIAYRGAYSAIVALEGLHDMLLRG